MFSNSIKVEWAENSPREMILLEDVSFADSNGKIWQAPAGSLIDGASIPRFFWRAIGSPFIGKYRRASVIHDVYCVERSEPHKEVHKMFHEAMLYDGVKAGKARAMYDAVKTFGPKWDKNKKDLKAPDFFDDEDYL